MKKAMLIAVILLLALMATGCMTDNQLKGEQAYYRAMVALKTQQAAQPIFKMTPAKEGEPIVLTNVGLFEIYAPRPEDKLMPQYVHQDFGVKKVFDVAERAVLPIAGTIVLKSAFDAAKGNNTNYTQTVTGENNTGRIAGPSNINANVAGNSNTLGGAVEQQIPTTTTTTLNTTTTTTTTPTTTTTGTTTTGDVNLTP